eukprot:scaffold35860_cov129-Isochrysis_galbana.AAC.3
MRAAGAQGVLWVGGGSGDLASPAAHEAACGCGGGAACRWGQQRRDKKSTQTIRVRRTTVRGSIDGE